MQNKVNKIDQTFLRIVEDDRGWNFEGILAIDNFLSSTKKKWSFLSR